MKHQPDAPFNVELDKYVGRQLILLRDKNSFSQSDMGKILGVSYQQVQKYESGRSRLDVKKLMIIKDKLGVSAEFFFAGFQAEQGSKLKTKNRPEAILESEILEMISCFLRIKSMDKRAKLVSIAREYSEPGAPAPVKS